MGRVEIYVETVEGNGIYEPLDLYKEENIEIQFKVKDKNDIGKVFSTFSKSFTIPASDNNKKLIRYFFNTDVVRTSNNFINVKVYINKNLFKVGKIKIDSQNSSGLIGKSITLTFFTVASTLKSLIGEDKLSSLTDEYPFTWTSNNFINSLNDDYNQGVFVPLISNYRVLTYNSGTNDIKWINSSTTYPNAINFNELRPAMKFSMIMDSVLAKYNLDVDRGGIFNRTEYDNLYVHLNKEELNTEISLSIQNPITYTGSYSLVMTSTASNTIFNITKVREKVLITGSFSSITATEVSSTLIARIKNDYNTEHP